MAIQINLAVPGGEQGAGDTQGFYGVMEEVDFPLFICHQMSR